MATGNPEDLLKKTSPDICPGSLVWSIDAQTAVNIGPSLLPIVLRNGGLFSLGNLLLKGVNGAT